MEQKTIDLLKPNPNNPRIMSKEDAKALAKSIQEFGDLSAVVFNVRTQQLVDGHMRVSVIKEMLGGGQIIITSRLEQPDEFGTVALGYLAYKTQRLSYREVDWPLERETAANIAANKIQGDWNDQLLAEANYLLQQNAPDLLTMTGQDEKEWLKSLSLVSGTGEPESDDTNQERPEPEKWTFTLTLMQSELVHQVLDRIKRENSLQPKDHGTALFYLCRQYQDSSDV